MVTLQLIMTSCTHFLEANKRLEGSDRPRSCREIVIAIVSWEKKTRVKMQKGFFFFTGYTILLALESQHMLWKECMSWKLVRFFQPFFNFLAMLKSELEKHFMLLLDLAHSPSFQTYPVTKLYLWAYVGISASWIVLPFYSSSWFSCVMKTTLYYFTDFSIKKWNNFLSKVNMAAV